MLNFFQWLFIQFSVRFFPLISKALCTSLHLKFFGNKKTRSILICFSLHMNWSNFIWIYCSNRVKVNYNILPDFIWFTKPPPHGHSVFIFISCLFCTHKFRLFPVRSLAQAHKILKKRKSQIYISVPHRYGT